MQVTGNHSVTSCNIGTIVQNIYLIVFHSRVILYAFVWE